jgi:uncharacterized peroxidase-related enzyme
MNRINTPAIESATGATAELFAQIKKAVGVVPNTYAAIGSLYPAALQAVLQAEAVPGTLSKQDKEIIKVVVSNGVGCDYCLAAHFTIGKLTGLSADALKKIIAGQASGNAKQDALAHFVRLLTDTSGTISAEEFSTIKAAGYTDAEIVEISFVIALITFTNVFNRVNDTVVDFPAVA